MTKIFSLFLLFPCFALADDASVLAAVHSQAPKVAQVIWVQPTTTPTSTAQLWTYDGHQWMKRGSQFAVVVGHNGTTPALNKFEGDGKTPEGLYPLVELFGRGPRSGLKMTYNMIDSNDKWVDDQTSPNYNQWVRGDTAAKSFENLLRADTDYDLFAVIGYNMKPIVPGKGSAIFMHIWTTPDKGTSGCVAMDPKQLGRVIDWLDTKSEPSILIGNLKILPK